VREGTGDCVSIVPMASAESVSAPSERRTAWERNLRAPVRRFLRTETSGAIVLVAAAFVALVWANVGGSYEEVWTTRLTISVGDHALGTDLRGWVNEGLMTLFFLEVGLEAKRELDLGELRERRRLAIPVLAAVGGMGLAAATYLAVNAGGEGARGWGTAVSTDTALALGTLALLTGGRAVRLRVFLLTLLVVDDLLALGVITFAYSSHIAVVPLVIAGALLAILVGLRYAPSGWRGPVAALTGVGLWAALFESGVDAVVAGLAIGLATSAYPPSREDLERSTAITRSFREQPTPELAYQARASLTSAISPNERLQYRLHPWTSWVIVPVFGLANVGLHVDGDLLQRAVSSPVTLGIVAAYLVGKPIGVAVAAWLGTRPVLGAQRPPVTWPTLAIGASVAGVGFTVSLLVASLTFSGPLLGEAKAGIIATALLMPGAAWLMRLLASNPLAGARRRQLAGTAEELIDLVDDVDPARDHVRGNPEAAVTLLEYGDFECPYCGQAEQIIRELLAGAGEDLRYVFRHLPLNDVHANAETAAEAAEAAAAQGAFWAMHDVLLAHQEELTMPHLLRYAGELGLDVQRFAREVRTGVHAERIARDVESADASGVSGTPTFFVNGRRHQGAYDVATLTAAVRAAKLRARSAAGEFTAR